MSTIQRIFTRIVPRAWAEDMRAESERWMVQCPCGYERSVWAMGGIRWKAVGNPRKWLHCPQCGQASWHAVYKKE